MGTTIEQPCKLPGGVFSTPRVLNVGEAIVEGECVVDREKNGKGHCQLWTIPSKPALYTRDPSLRAIYDITVEHCTKLFDPHENSTYYADNYLATSKKPVNAGIVCREISPGSGTYVLGVKGSSKACQKVAKGLSEDLGGELIYTPMPPFAEYEGFRYAGDAPGAYCNDQNDLFFGPGGGQGEEETIYTPGTFGSSSAATFQPFSLDSWEGAVQILYQLGVINVWDMEKGVALSTDSQSFAIQVSGDNAVDICGKTAIRLERLDMVARRQITARTSWILPFSLGASVLIFVSIVVVSSTTKCGCFKMEDKPLKVAMGFYDTFNEWVLCTVLMVNPRFMTLGPCGSLRANTAKFVIGLSYFFSIVGTIVWLAELRVFYLQRKRTQVTVSTHFYHKMSLFAEQIPQLILLIVYMSSTFFKLKYDWLPLIMLVVTALNFTYSLYKYMQNRENEPEPDGEFDTDAIEQSQPESNAKSSKASAPGEAKTKGSVMKSNPMFVE